MLLTDIIYVLLLLLCVAVGPFYQRIQQIWVKQWVSTAAGLILATLVSGKFVLHPVISTLINAIIITTVSPRKCHLVSIYFSFFYLLVIFRLEDMIGLPIPPTQTNLIMMILTLKMSGLAFEVNSANNPALAPDDPDGVNSTAMKKVGFLDVIHYAFSYMGILTGPYYRYRTYWDSMHRPFSKCADPWPVTFYKLKQIAVFVVLYLIMGETFPTKYILTEEYGERSFIYRYLYMYPSFVTFRLRMYIGMILAECACQMAGVGAYPTSCSPIQGLGPRDYKTTEKLSNTASEIRLKREKYDYLTVCNMNVWGVETCILTRHAMKEWNTCVQYWMATCVYKRFPHKGLRTLATFTLSALWHGYAPGYYFCICQIPIFLLVEDVVIKFYKQSEESSLARRGWGTLLWYLKTTCMAYLATAFLLLNYEDLMHHYKSVYFMGQIQVIVLYLVARSLRPYILTGKLVENKEKVK